MSRESFKILKEINSLASKITELELICEKENKRLLFIQNSREQKSNELLEYKESLSQTNKSLHLIENEIASLSLKIDSDQANLNSIIAAQALSSMEKQIEENSSKLSEFEEEGLNKLEVIESLDQNISDCEEFLKGSQETLDEITKEVSEITSMQKSEILKTQNRINLLKEELPNNFKSKLELILNQKLKGSSFTRIKSDACEYCRFTLSKVEVSKIEDQLALQTCKSCSRIFIPISASY